MPFILFYPLRSIEMHVRPLSFVLSALYHQQKFYDFEQPGQSDADEGGHTPGQGAGGLSVLPGKWHYIGNRIAHQNPQWLFEQTFGYVQSSAAGKMTQSSIPRRTTTKCYQKQSDGVGLSPLNNNPIKKCDLLFSPTSFNQHHFPLQTPRRKRVIDFAPTRTMQLHVRCSKWTLSWPRSWIDRNDRANTSAR